MCASLLLLLAACATTDPRGTWRDAEHTITGGWIEIVPREDGEPIQGELIAVESHALLVLVGKQMTTGWRPREVRRILLAKISRARLLAYDVGDELGRWFGWGVLATAPTLVIPLAWSAAGMYGELHRTAHRTVSYPGDGLRALATWARFPQGLPPKMKLRKLLPGKTPPFIYHSRGENRLSPPGMTPPYKPPPKPPQRPGMFQSSASQ